jgi:predicted Rdx family selenoprotein
MGDDRAPILAWDRKVEGGFPELKVLVGFDLVPRDVSIDPVSQKQRIRDRVDPNKSLGHSDVAS